MAAPAGYTELGRIGFVDRGTYASGTTYRIGDVVYYNGSTWSALKDNLKGVTPVAGANWKYMARGFAAEALSAVTAKDTSGVLGTAGASVTSQALVDAIADKVMTKLIEKSKIVNNLLATDATTVLSGPMGKYLDEKIGKVNSDLALEDVGNAVAATNWTVVASNRVMNNDLGMVYGKIIHNASVAPVWGELVATFPGFKSYYDMPLPLYCTDGNLYITANLNAAGQIKLYNPDLAKLNTKDKVYSFTAVYLRKK